MHVLVQAGDSSQRDLSWWQWGHARYSPVRSRQDNADRLCGVCPSRQAIGASEFNSHRSAFSSLQPRTVALPTHRTNDSRLANSQWGSNHAGHYSGEGVGPGQYSCGIPWSKPYKGILHEGCIESLGLLSSSLARRKTIVHLVRKHVSSSLMLGGFCHGHAAEHNVSTGPTCRYSGLKLESHNVRLQLPGRKGGHVHTKAVSRVSCWRHQGKSATQKLTA